MFSCKSGYEYKYDLSEEKFRIGFEFLKRKDLANLPQGWIELGLGVRASIQHYNTSDYKENKFETHERFFDIQYVIEGEEYCGVCDRSLCTEVTVPYSKEADIAFYKDPENCGMVLLETGDFIVLAPEDAHKPRCNVKGSVFVKKVVIKVPV
ncbi:MAG: YhcH/YjgK/YiaL family protein [Sphaerochaetaceae bacterium]|nr:YhcH/YjgK/YiaL family protein [Sphaerochaetaceae bacterium]